MARFFLDRDNDGHWYLIPQAHRAEWDAFCDIDQEDPAAWDVPEWAKPLGHSLNLVTFENPIVKD